MVLAHEILTSILTGGKWTRYIKSLYEEDKSGIQRTCHSFMAIDPDCFTGREKFKKDMECYIRSIKESGKAKNATEILMPGVPEYRTEAKRLKEGIPLESTTLRELLVLGKSSGIPLSLMG